MRRTILAGCALLMVSTVGQAQVTPDPVDPHFANGAFVGEQPRYETWNAGEGGPDHLGEPRRVAAAVIAADLPAPRRIVEVGAHSGEFLEAFLERFPQAHGQWTEPVEDNHDNATRRFARLGAGRVDYVVGCPNRDLAEGCVKPGADVLITSWLTIHRNLAGIRDFYARAAKLLPKGGWVANMDHVRSLVPGWDRQQAAARADLRKAGLTALQEGPRVHHADYVMPTLDDQLAAMRAAGFRDPQVVWRRLDTVMIVAKKS